MSPTIDNLKDILRGKITAILWSDAIINKDAVLHETMDVINQLEKVAFQAGIAHCTEAVLQTIDETIEGIKRRIAAEITEVKGEK